MRLAQAAWAWILLGALSVPPCQSQPAAARPPLGEPGSARLISPYSPYTLKLTSFAPSPGQVTGVLLKARINSGPELRLLLDSGAEYLTLDSKAAMRSSLRGASDLVLVGASRTGSGVAASAAKVEIGPLVFSDCPVNVVRKRMPGGIDGVIPLALFAGFLVRLDLPAKTLGLEPYPEGAMRPAGSSGGAGYGSLLLVKAVVNEALEGYVLLDTGAAYTGISFETAHALRSRPVESLHLADAAGDLTGDRVGKGIRFRIAGQELKAGDPVALDLRTVSGYNGLELIGVLGYPDLRCTVLNVNYREARIGIELEGDGK